MKRPIEVAIVAALMLGGATVQAEEKDAPPPKAPEASIPFVNSTASIREWEADGKLGLWVQDARRQWYYARLNGPCEGLDFAVKVGFATRTTNTLDRFASVVVPGSPSCPIVSFTKSEAPPDRKQDQGANGG